MPNVVGRVDSAGKRTYHVRWRENGKQRSKVCDTKAAAKRLRALIIAHDGYPDLSVGDLAAAPTLREYADHWSAHLTGVSNRTRDDYRRQLDRHVMPTMGDVPLPGITKDVIRRWVIAQQASAMSTKTLKNVKGTLSALLSSAVEDDHLLANPCKGVPIGRADDHSRKEPQFLTREEFWSILTHIDEHWKPYFILLMSTGLRLGEMMALTVGDVDLLAQPPVVRVTKALRYTRGKGFEVGPTKTRRSRRTVTLPPLTVDVLVPCVARPSGDQLVVGKAGMPVYPTNLYARVWRPAVEAAQAEGLTKNPRIHDLRHSHAASQIAEGTSLPMIQARLGHEDIKTTINVYGHLEPAVHVQAAEAAQRALSPR